MLAVAQAWMSSSEGDTAAALASVRAVMPLGITARHRWLWQPGWLLPALLIALQAGDADLAAHITSQTQMLRNHNPSVPTNAALAACALALTTGSTPLLTSAYEIAGTSPRSIIQAQITTLLGQRLLDKADRPAGVAMLAHAWEIYTRVGAHREARRVQQLMQAAGVRRRQWSAAATRPTTGWLSLTEGEQRVARLIAVGHTNRSAAAELVLSPNTIATHLRSVFIKLGVKSRVQLALAVTAAGERD